MSISGLGTSVFNGVPMDTTTRTAPSDGAGPGSPIDTAALGNLAAIDTTRISLSSLRQDLKALHDGVSVRLETLLGNNLEISPLQRQQIRGNVEQQLAAGIDRITALAEQLQRLPHPGDASAAAQQLHAAISQLVEGISGTLKSLAAQAAAQPAVDLASLPSPTDVLLYGRLQAHVADPAGATAQDKLLGEMVAMLPRTPEQQAVLQQTRADLGRLRIELAQDMAFMKESGMQLPPDELHSLQERMDSTIQRAAKLESQLADQLGLKTPADTLRQERAQLDKASETAIRSLYKLKDDRSTSPAAFARALVATNAAILKSAAQQGILTTRLDAMLGVMSPVEHAVGQLQGAFEKIAALKAGPSMPWGAQTQQIRQLESTIPLLVGKLAEEVGGDESAAMEIADLMQKKADLAAPKPLNLWSWINPDKAAVQRQIDAIDKQINLHLNELQTRMAQVTRRPANPPPATEDIAADPNQNTPPSQQEPRGDTIAVPDAAAPYLR